MCRGAVVVAKLSEEARRTVSLFVDEMRSQREQRGWTQPELAQRAKYSKALIAAVENYDRAPTVGLAAELDEAFGLPETFQRLHKRMGSVAFPIAFGEFAEIEQAASELFIWEHALLPGLLQSEDYARHVLSRHPNVTDDQIAERLAARMARQTVLTREDPPAPVVWVLIDGQALRRPIGSPEVMHAALHHVLKLAERPNVTVQVVPLPDGGGHPGLLGTFYLAEHDASPTTLFIEDIADGRITEDPATVREVRLRWRYLGTLASSADASADLIKREVEQWKPSETRGASRHGQAATAGAASRSRVPQTACSSATPRTVPPATST
jgi:transcriptional regulator with XRE-family HTH domain